MVTIYAWWLCIGIDQVAALEALAALTSSNNTACQQLLQQDGGAVIEQLLSLAKQRAPRTRLLCGACITNLSASMTAGHCLMVGHDSHRAVLTIR